MSIFKRNKHKHTWHLLSSDNLVKEQVRINGVLIHQAEYTTVVVEQCDTCPALREQQFTGCHAANIKQNYKAALCQ